MLTYGNEGSNINKKTRALGAENVEENTMPNESPRNGVGGVTTRSFTNTVEDKLR